MAAELTLTTERIDDLVLLLHVMLRLSLPDILDRHLPRHWLQAGLSWGWVATIWLAGWAQTVSCRRAIIGN